MSKTLLLSHYCPTPRLSPRQQSYPSSTGMAWMKPSSCPQRSQGHIKTRRGNCTRSHTPCDNAAAKIDTLVLFLITTCFPVKYIKKVVIPQIQTSTFKFSSQCRSSMWSLATSFHVMSPRSWWLRLNCMVVKQANLPKGRPSLFAWTKTWTWQTGELLLQGDHVGN